MARRLLAESGFWLVAAAPCIAVLALPELVVQDGGLHLSSATALGELFAGDFRDVIEVRAVVPPNLTVEVLLLGLLHVMGPGWALKLVVVAVLAGFAAAARYLVVAAGASGPWALLLLPFAWNRPLAWGFLGFSLAIVLLLVIVAVVLRRPDRPPVVLLGLLLTITWLTHLVPALIATGVCVVVAASAALVRRQAGHDPRWVASIGSVIVAAIPILVLSAVFVVANPGGGYYAPPGSVLHRALGVLGATTADVSTVQVEYPAYRLVAVLMIVSAGVLLVGRFRTGPGLRPADGMLVAAALGVVGAVVAPRGVEGGGGFLAMRIALVPALLLAAWLAGELGRPRHRRAHRSGAAAVAGAIAAISLVLVVARFPVQRQFGQQVADLRQLAACLPRSSTVYQLTLEDGSTRAVEMSPFSEQVGFLAAERNGMDMGNESGWVPYYLWRYRPSQRPDLLLGTAPNGVFTVPPRIDLAGALARGLRLDAVVVVGRNTARSQVLDDAPTREALADLSRAYTRVATSSGGFAELWLRNGIAPSCG